MRTGRRGSASRSTTTPPIPTSAPDRRRGTPSTGRETARPFVPVQGAHDIYRAGEYMIWTDGTVQWCKSDTNFSPADYPQAWEEAPAEPEEPAQGDAGNE